MAERNGEHGSPCMVEGCPTDVQGGIDGMLGHLQIVHFPDLTRATLEEKYCVPLFDVPGETTSG
jgi:hypothetical protein